MNTKELGKQKEALLSFEMVDRLLRYVPETGKLYWKEAWSNNVVAGAEAGSKSSRGYIRIQINGKEYKAHRLAWLLFYEKWPEDEIDHIDHIRDNNRITNLREASRADQQKNQKQNRNNSTGVTGVYYLGEHRDYRAVHTIGGTQKANYFKTFEEAVAFRKAMEIELNFHPNHGTPLKETSE